MSIDAINEPILDADDIQGHILPGFNRPASLLIGLALENLDALQRVTQQVIPHVTSMRNAFSDKIVRKEARLGLRTQTSCSGTFLAISFSGRALNLHAGGAELSNLDSSFSAGMSTSSTGDASAPKLANGLDNPSAFIHWKVGNNASPLDALLIFAGESAQELEALYSEISNGWQGAAIQEVYREEGIRLPGESEHFGFRDGISMPGVYGRIESENGLQQLTTRYNVPDGRDGVQFGRPGQPMVWPAQFIFGTHSSPNKILTVPPLAKNGSLLVFRRLEQDVEAFDRDTHAMASSLSADGVDTASPDRVRAWLVGRWPNGQPLVRCPVAPSEAENDFENNHFGYEFPSPQLSLQGKRIAPASSDTDGAKCPFFAHIRKVNPRDRATDQGPAAVTRSMQMLRRGIPFGPQYDRNDPGNPINTQKRGLLFLAYQSSISNQFEKIQTRWANQANAPEPTDDAAIPGQDAIIGTTLRANRTPGTRFIRRDGKQADILERWVILTGGGYLFAPSISALAILAQPPS